MNPDRLLLGILLILFPILSFTRTPLSSYSRAAAASEYYVDANHGNDSSGDGTQAKPWRTITHAMSSLASGDTLHILPGVYDSVLGETFPITVKPGIALVGSGLEATIVSGEPEQAVLYFDSLVYSYLSNTTINDLTAQNGSAGIAVRATGGYNASPTLTRLRLRWNTRGVSLDTGDVYADGSTVAPLMSEVEVRENAEAGIFLYAYGYFSPSFVMPTIEDSFIIQNGGPGIHIEASATSTNGTTAAPIIRRTTIVENGGDGLYNVGTYQGWIKPQVEQSLIAGNSGYGFYYDMGINGGNIDAHIDNTIVRENRGGGVYVGRRSYFNYANGLLYITNSNIVDNSNYGIYWHFVPDELVAPVVKNTLIWNPGADDLYSTADSWTTSYISHSNILDGDVNGQAGNISMDPLFLDEYHISACSPMMNAGTTEGAPLVDLDGEHRPEGSSVDIGVDEYEARCSLKVDKHASADRLLVSDSLTYTLTLTSILTDTAITLDLTDKIATGSSYVPDSLWVSKGEALYANGVVSWSGVLTPQESMTVTFQAQAEKGGISLVNRAMVDAGEYGLYASPPHIAEVSLRQVFLPRLLSFLCSGNFLDDFANPESGWATSDDDYVLAEYNNSEFRINSRQAGYINIFGAPTCPRENYVVEVDARWNDEPGASYGLIFGLQGDFESFYLFEVNTDYQLYVLSRYDSLGTSVIAPVAESLAINPGQSSNHLKVIRNGPWIYLEVNGVQLGSWQDSNISGLTGVGIAASPYDDHPRSDARFDNFSLTELPAVSTSATHSDASIYDAKSSAALSYPWLLVPHPASLRSINWVRGR